MEPRFKDEDAVADLAENGRAWYRTASEEQLEAIVDHIRTEHKSHASPVTPQIRAQAIMRVAAGDVDGVKVHATGSTHYLVRDLGVTVYVSVTGSEYVDMPEKLDSHWSTIMAYRVVDKNRHAQKAHATKPVQPVVDVDVY